MEEPMQHNCPIPECPLKDELNEATKLLSKLSSLVDSHATYISDSKGWRATLVAVVITMAINVGGGLYFAGQITERLETVQKVQMKVLEKNERQDDNLRSIEKEVATYIGASKTK